MVHNVLGLPGFGQCADGAMVFGVPFPFLLRFVGFINFKEKIKNKRIDE